ncbi:membrane protein [Streptomyces mashuensis]|uniref:Membrane protein n=1 Tax=Streptomyces mashuensis TaxID=33904 RepID=A0A919ED70_9ACTN|nr:hypothetical protein [Streptomyces mashuensis]GHF46759.1 membrane protein [Streptomyces mashuensis]
MGIESDQLIYDYLSRVGDIAQRQSLTSGDRMRLVTRLRTEIERRRAAEGADDPAAVRRILDGFGTPAEAVAGADAVLAGGGSGSSEAGGRVPAQRRAPADGGALPPHLAPEEELRPPGGGDPEWWRIEPGPLSGGDRVHGFTGGIEVADMLRPPRPETVVADGAAPPPATGAVPAAGGTGTPVGKGAREDKDGKEPGAPRFSFWRSRAGVPMSPLLLLVAALLVAGAVIGNWLVLLAGWGLAYITRRLTERESQWAVMGVPGLTALAGITWLWGRTEGRWGDPIPQGGLGAALSETWPVVVRAAAVASAAFVLWRARRPG